MILAPVPADMAGRIALGAIRRLEKRQGRFPRLVHLILPDKHARFPEDADCDPTFREIQDISWVLD